MAFALVAMLVSGFAGLAMPGASAQSAIESPTAWVWANEPETDNYTPDTRYQFNSTGAENTVARNGVGDYTVTFPGFTEETGLFLVTGQGAAASCSIARWALSDAGMNLDVLCYDGAGAPVDSGFSAMHSIPTGDRTGGYVWLPYEVAEAPEVNSRFSYNSTGAENTITRNGVGDYTATFPGVGSEGGNFQVTGQGPATSCTITNWVLDGDANMSVNIRCYAAGGEMTDNGFIATYGTAIFETPGAYLVTNDGALELAADDALYQGSSYGAGNTVTRTDTGVYMATLTGAAQEAGHFQVTGHGSAASCTVSYWGLDGADMYVEVLCFGADGAMVDSGFSLAYNVAP